MTLKECEDRFESPTPCDAKPLRSARSDTRRTSCKSSWPMPRASWETLKVLNLLGSSPKYLAHEDAARLLSSGGGERQATSEFRRALFEKNNTAWGYHMKMFDMEKQL